MSKKNKQKPVPQIPVQKIAETAKPDAPKVASASLPTLNLLEKIQGKETYIAAILLLAIGCFIYQDYIFGDYLFFFRDIGSDSLNTIYPNIVFHAEYLKNEGIPAWSFQQGMGQNIYPFWFDQFYFILYLMNPDTALKSTGTLQMIEVILSGLMFMTYLKTLRLSSISIIIGSICYAFCGFTVACGGWDNRFVVEAFNLALLLLALERFIQKDSWWLLPIPIALIAMNQPFDLYIFGILILVYTVFRLTDLNGWKPQKLIVSLLRIGAICAIGIGLSSVMFLENVQQLINSPRVSGGASYASKLTSSSTFAFGPFYETILARFFGNDLMGTGGDHKGWNNYFESPFLYFGFISLLAAPQLIVFQHFNRKIMYGILLALCALVLAIPNIRFVFWLYTGDYFRTLTLFIGLVLIFMSAKAITKIDAENKISWLTLAITLVALAGILFTIDNDLINKSLRIVILLFLVLNSVGLFALSKRNFKVVGQVGLIILVAVELIIFSSKSIDGGKRTALRKSELNERIAYKDYTLEAVDYVKKQDQSFHRFDKDYASSTAIFASLSDPKAQGYFGTKSYHSFNQLNYIKFLQGMDFIKPEDETGTRWANGVTKNLLVQSLCDVKYLMSKQPNNQLYFGMAWDSLGKFGDVTLLRNRLAVPLGSGYDKYVLAEDFKALNSDKKAEVILKAAVIESKQVELFKGLTKISLDSVSMPFTVTAYQNAAQKLQAQSMVITKFNNNHIEGTIDLNTSKLVFFSIPFDAGWHVLVDGKEQTLEKINIGFTGMMIEKGRHTIELNYIVPLRKTGTYLSLLMLFVYGGLVFFFRKK